MDFSSQISADKKAGYPPNCNEGYAEKDGKCVPIEEVGAPGWSGPNVYKPKKKAKPFKPKTSAESKKKRYAKLWKKVKSK